MSDPDLVETMAIALSRLGGRAGDQKAIVVYGREHLDEAGLADFSNLAVVNGQEIDIVAVSPQMLDLEPAPTEAIKGGDVQVNAEILKSVLQGKGTKAQRQVVAYNAALALRVGEALPAGLNDVEALRQGAAIAQDVLSSGEAWHKLEQLSRFLK